MNTIKFSHKYEKLPIDYKNSMLLQIIILDSSNITDYFYNYDTSYSYPTGHHTGHYKLPVGKLILLLLLTEKNNLWTTIRSWTPEKEKYYKSICGQIINCEVQA